MVTYLWHRVKPKDSSRLIAYEEIADLSYPWHHLNGSTSSLVNFATDLQDLNIELTVNMLNRVNPYTGLRYADDPALSFVEFQNEDDIFWAAIERSLEQAPTYKKMLSKQFSLWLKEKYGTDERLKIAWGKKVAAR
ncbi:beta-galactosidase [Winogradskyella maritima]|nr:beta-galactosidase [Winogradskyella maritima]